MEHPQTPVATKEFHFLMEWIFYTIDDLIDHVLEDSEEDPHYSAVTATNMIKCLIKTMADHGEPLSYTDAEGYFRESGYSPEDFRLFEENRLKEIPVFHGEIF